MFSRSAPYNDLPTLPPESDLQKDVKILNALAPARAALAELKGRIPIIPNPLMLINTIVLNEAKDSSTIENIVTSSDNLFRALSSERKDIEPNIKEVLRYREALWDAYNNLNQMKLFDTELMVRLFRNITQRDEELRKLQVFVGSSRNIVYTPPEPGNVLNEKLNNWIIYCNSEHQIDHLIKMAILHYQFESIHPFTDGNGRTGRILNVLYLTKNNLIDLPILYHSKYILENREEYYRLFTEVTENGNWQDWIIYMLNAVEETSLYTLGKVNAIYDLFQNVIEKVRLEASKIYSRELVEILFYQPYCRISTLVKKGIATRNTASKYLHQLADLGILELKSDGKESLFLNTELYYLLSLS
ncbi:MAG: Fic/DOC family N-terminal domain-containing protein [Ignavibacteriaceae bacterium]